MLNGTGNFRNFQTSSRKDNLERRIEIFETNFRKLSVPFDFEPEFLEILVEWNAPDVFQNSYPFQDLSENEKQRIAKDRASSVFPMTILRHNATFQFKNMFQQNLQFNKVQSWIYSVHRMLIDYRHFQAFSVQFQACEAWRLSLKAMNDSAYFSRKIMHNWLVNSTLNFPWKPDTAVISKR